MARLFFLIDNIDISNANHTVLLSKFIEENSGNRYIFNNEGRVFSVY